jgi:hypothetical protein
MFLAHVPSTLLDALGCWQLHLVVMISKHEALLGGLALSQLIVFVGAAAAAPLHLASIDS